MSPAASGPTPGEVVRTLYVLAGLRILLGVLWLANLAWKLPPDFGKTSAQKLEAEPARPRLLVTEPGVGYRLRDRVEKR